MRSPTGQIDRFWASDWALTVLLAFLMTLIFLVRPLEGFGVDVRLVTGLGFSLILISGIVAVSHSRRWTMLFGIVAALTMAVHWARFVIFGPPWIGVDAAASITACGMLAAIVLVHVFREGPITVQRIQGAVAAYLLLALVFASGFTLIDLYVADAFAGPALTIGERGDPFQRFLYFSFVTLTTTGYGDITPVAPASRSLAMFESLIGQMFPAILLARLVSMEMYYRQRRFEHEQAARDREMLGREMPRRSRAKSE
jgi:hypothetical protein